MLSVVLVGLNMELAPAKSELGVMGETYKWHSAVAAHGNLGLVGVDEDLGVAGRTATALTCHHTFMCPPHGLLVNHLDRRLRLGLFNGSAPAHYRFRDSGRFYLEVEVGLLETGAGHGL